MRWKALSVLGVVVCLAGLIPAQDSRATNGGISAGRKIRASNGRQYAHQGVSPFDPIPSSDALFVVDTAPGLDTTCTYRRGGPLLFEIVIDRYMGPTNSDGTLANVKNLVANGVISPTARLRMPVWDVDYEGAPGYTPERDRVLVNGTDVGYLHGDNNTWELNQLDVPIEIVRFGRLSGTESSPIPGRNYIQIDIDVANTSEVWCTAVDWAALSFGTVAPLMLVNGTAGKDRAWQTSIDGQSPVSQLAARGVVSDVLELDTSASPDANAARLSTLLSRSATILGVRNVHLVAHGKGATDARRFLRTHHRPDSGTVRVLSLFAIGSPSQGTVLSDYALAAERVDLKTIPSPSQAVSDALIAARSAHWLNLTGLLGKDPARESQTSSKSAEFNTSNTKTDRIPYYSIAGNADTNGNGSIEESEARELLPAGFTQTATVGNRLYQMLGRSERMAVIETVGPTGKKYRSAVAPYSAGFEPNDLFATAGSVHFAPFFQPLVTTKRNHLTEANATVFDLILRMIRVSYPLDY
jgi:triacylglycerol lipase